MACVLVTGGAGFIGFHLHRELEKKHRLIAFDLLAKDNPASMLRSTLLPGVQQGDIHSDFISGLQHQPDVVVHLAAETGIAGSLKYPHKYFNTNVAGTFNLLEQCRKNNIRHLVYASSSSVYSPHQSIMREDGDTSHQLSFYGTTKKMSEVMIENYCRQYGITAIGLRFFTVYGSFTRPDMAAYKFMKAINAGQLVTLYNNGSVFRDFTHVSDIVKSISLVIDKLELEEAGSHRIFNIGYGAPVSVKAYALCIAANLGKELVSQSLALPANEVASTHSDTGRLQQYIHYAPVCGMQQGVREMTDWFKLQRYE